MYDSIFDEVWGSVKGFPSYLWGLVLGLVIAITTDPATTMIFLGSVFIGFASGNALIGAAVFFLVHALLRVFGEAIAYRNR